MHATFWGGSAAAGSLVSEALPCAAAEKLERGAGWRTTLVALLLLASALPAHAAARGKQPPVVAGVPAATAPSPFHAALTGVDATTAAGDAVSRPGTQCRARDTLTYHGGALILNPQIFVLFWGSNWASPAHQQTHDTLVSMYQQIGTSPYACSWAEYATTPGPSGAGTYLGAYTIATDPPLTQGELTDDDIQQEIVHQIQTNAANVPAPTTDTIYIVVPPDGTPVNAFGETSCGGSNFTFCGYHSSFTDPSASVPLRYAVLPYPCNSQGFTCFIDPQQTAGGSLQVVGSHEVGEIATDPDSPPVGLSGWYSEVTGAENADICNAISCEDTIGSGANAFLVNSLWSNLARGCVSGVPCTPPADPPDTPCTDQTPGECVPGIGAHGCGFEWLVYPNMTATSTGLPGRTITCKDGQLFCDFDGTADGQCTFHVAACLNNADPRRISASACVPSSITNVQVSQPRLSSTRPADQSNAQNAFAALQGIAANTLVGSRVVYTSPVTTANRCSNFFDVVVPVNRAFGPSQAAGSRMLSVAAKMGAATVSNRLTLICQPGPP